jgi:hypothetical protein
MTTQHNAKRIIRELHNLLKCVPTEALRPVAKGLAKEHKLPQKTMLKAMARYIRLHHTA